MYTLFACLILFAFYGYKKKNNQLKKIITNWKINFICLLAISLSFIKDLNLSLLMPTDLLTLLLDPLKVYVFSL